jgi:hypothetical protein
MREAIRSIAMCVAFALVAGMVGGCGSSDRVVARVDGDPIVKTVLSHWTAIGAAVDGPHPTGRATSSRRALGFLISAKWLTIEARELGLSVSARKARRQLEVLAYDQRAHTPYYGELPQDPELRRLLLSEKVRWPDRLWLMKLGMLATDLERERLAQAKHEISHAEVAGYYEVHGQEFFVPKRSDMDILGSYNRAVVVKARREIEAGKSFLTIARRVTIDPEAPNGVQHLIQGREEPPFEKVIFGAPPHVLVGPVHYGFYYLFRVYRATPAHRKPLAQVEAEIGRKLASTRASTKLRAAFEAKWAARTSCQAGYVVPRCRQYARLTPSSG